LLEGNSVVIDGRTFFIDYEGEDAHQSWIPVNKWNYEEMMQLADGLEGVEYAKVMNYKGVKKWTKRSQT
jgi:hypothetical protein